MQGEYERYTHGHDPVVVGAHAQRNAANSAAFLLPHLRDGVRLLDFGCGPGSITADLAGNVRPTGMVLGIDNSSEAVAVAQRDSAAERVEYVQASVYDIPVADDSFDIAYGHQVLQHLADPVAALREVHRVVKPGGIVAVRDADYGSMTHHPHYQELDAWLSIYHAVARANGGEPDAGRRLPEWVMAAGFAEPRVTTSTWTYSRSDERASWAHLWAERITLPIFADRAAELGLAGRNEIAMIAAAWIEWGKEPAGWFRFIHGEVIATASES